MKGLQLCTVALILVVVKSDPLYFKPRNPETPTPDDYSNSALNSLKDAQKEFRPTFLGLVLNQKPRKADVICGDGSSCPADTTCCETDKGFNCCPFPKATCCNDKVHCCPENYECDMGTKTCKKTGMVSFPALQKIQPRDKTGDVKCPDQSECPDLTTCCPMQSGGYGCCPYPSATCCPDKEHCCPNGYTCDADSCNKDDISIPLVKKLPSKASVGNVPCPDGSSCPQTCCSIGGGRYGCCPYTLATCCPDYVHCCPNGYICNWNSCTRGDVSIPLVKKLPSKAPSSDVPCPDGSSCPSGYTCCRGVDGDYGCCPYTEAVCCPDKESCCPNGYTCEADSCSKDDVSIPLVKKLPSKAPVSDVTCPDGSSCPAGNTCCSIGGGRYACCPLTQATCCPDYVHCCPTGYTCNWNSCTRGDVSIPLVKKLPSKAPSSNVPCPDGSFCPSGYTCCRGVDGGYGCCPYTEAVCCPDKESCCPNGYTCDTDSCSKDDVSIPLVKKLPSKASVSNVKCLDGSFCPAGNTCCSIGGGRYACCPFTQATCCPDYVHCCPTGYTCNWNSCTKGEVSIPLVKKLPSIAPSSDVPCPDGSSCPSGNTCCRGVDGGYGCCPYTKATCCPDKEHCCPNGYTCDTDSCSKDDVSIPLVKKLPSKASVSNVKCLDGSFCPAGNTCCSIGGGRYACCPFTQATCCPDYVHCCPTGYTCNWNSCTKGEVSIPLVKKLPSIAPSSDVPCPDGSSCPSGYTCCRGVDGGYGCCPYTKATCCPDKEHCCPNGYTCDTDSCSKDDVSIPLVKKLPSKAPVSDVPCPDGSSCQTGQTCCSMGDARFGCCPFSQAVCCSDRKHCCPFGYTCDAVTATCTRGPIAISLLGPSERVDRPTSADSSNTGQVLPAQPLV